MLHSAYDTSTASILAPGKLLVTAATTLNLSSYKKLLDHQVPSNFLYSLSTECANTLSHNLSQICCYSYVCKPSTLSSSSAVFWEI